MKSFSYKIAAGDSKLVSYSGLVLTVKRCTLPLTVCFDGAVTDVNFKAGRVFDFRPTGLKMFNLTNPNAVEVQTEFIIDDIPAHFIADDNAVASASTYAYGNLGVATGAGAAGGLPACDANGFLQITNGMALLVTGMNNGHRRQKITFSMAANSPAPLNLLDLQNKVFMTILAGQQIALVDDSAYTLSGAGNTAFVTVGQSFFAA